MEGMERAWDSGRRASRSISRGMGMGNWGMEDVFVRSSTRGRSWGSRSGVDDDEEALRWAALEKLPTYSRLRTGILRSVVADGDQGRRQYQHKEVDVRKLDVNERQEFIERVFKVAEEDNERFLKKLRNRIDKSVKFSLLLLLLLLLLLWCCTVGIQLATVEVRFEHLNVEAKCHVGNRALPSLANTARDIAESAVGLLGINLTKRTTLTILKDISGIVQPSRLEEFVPQKTAAYISQNDVHVGEMTVKETFDFSARCQGVGSRYGTDSTPLSPSPQSSLYWKRLMKWCVSLDLLTELARREKEGGILPEAEVDLFMKATAIEGVKSSLQTDYTLRILGLDICADTIVGDEMHRGISGGQRKRVTTGEMIVGPTKVLFMDEISTGLDSSTTFQIVKCLQQIVHLGEATILMSLLQPAPETFELFDDIILLSEGQIVYQGPREFVLDFFEACGFRCPERKGTADFLQEYWADKERPYRYISVSEFAQCFKRFHVGLRLENELSVPFDKSQSHKAALVFSKKSVSTSELLRTSFAKEWLLIKRNSFVYIFKTVQVAPRTHCHSGAHSVNRVSEDSHAHEERGRRRHLHWSAPLRVDRQRLQRFRGAVHRHLATPGVLQAQGPALLSGMGIHLAQLSPPDSHIDPGNRGLDRHDLLHHRLCSGGQQVNLDLGSKRLAGLLFRAGGAHCSLRHRFFKQLVLVFLIQQMAAGLFRTVAGLCRSMIISNTGGALSVLIIFVLGGFILPKDGRPLGRAVLENASVFPEARWYWIGAGALLGFSILFNLLFTFFLMFLNRKASTCLSPYISPLCSFRLSSDCNLTQLSENHKLLYLKKQQQRWKKTETRRESRPESGGRPPRTILYLGNCRRGTETMPVSGGGIRTPTLAFVAVFSNLSSILTGEMMMLRMSPSGTNGLNRDMSIDEAATGVAPKRGMVLPFTPLAMSFDEVNYYVDMPAVSSLSHSFVDL
ncbi:hypothetical protein BHE74_00006705 [Ensete ventricosum]|nr:hypothetical protein BHE74_00006705 [Ensete ventricosum]